MTGVLNGVHDVVVFMVKKSWYGTKTGRLKTRGASATDGYWDNEGIRCMSAEDSEMFNEAVIKFTFYGEDHDKLMAEFGANKYFIIEDCGYPKG
jgi:hypothetical protein